MIDQLRGGSLLLYRLGATSTRGVECPLCGHRSLDIAYRPHRDTGRPTILVGCWHCRHQTDNYLRDLCTHLGVEVRQVLEADPDWIEGSHTKMVSTEALWTRSEIADAKALLGSTPSARDWLAERGIGKTARAKYDLGYGIRRGLGAIIIPVKEKRNGTSRVVNVRFRFFPDVPEGRKYDTLAGRGSQLYPSLVGLGDEIRPAWPLVLCAGEFDAIVARKNNVYAVTTTTGASIANDLLHRFKGEKVAVVFDVGEERRAAGVCEQLISAGAQAAAPVDLAAEFGMKSKQDITDYFMSYGGSGSELNKAARRAVDGPGQQGGVIELGFDTSKPYSAKSRRMAKRGGGPWGRET